MAKGKQTTTKHVVEINHTAYGLLRIHTTVTNKTQGGNHVGYKVVVHPGTDNAVYMIYVLEREEAAKRAALRYIAGR